MAKKYQVLKDFDFGAKPHLVMTFKAGEVRSNLTRKCIAKGEKLGALKLLSDSKEN